MVRKTSRAMWIWRAIVTTLLVVLLVAEVLTPGLTQFVLIVLGSGLFIMALDLIPGRGRHRKA